MPAPLSFAGTPASVGYAEGPLFSLDRSAGAYVAKGSEKGERAALEAALAGASARLESLIGEAADDAAEMLEFQLAMLQDEALTGPAFAAIEEGAQADDAWGACLEDEIAGYETAEDGYFRARAADLKDIRDQVLHHLTPHGAAALPAGAIAFGDDMAPTRFLEIDWSQGGGIALSAGSAASHVAMLARARGVPMVVGLGVGLETNGDPVLLDGENGRLVLDPSDQEREAFRARSAAFAERRASAEGYLGRPAATACGTAVRVMVNIADPSEVDRIDASHCDGVGLMRTEFLFGGARGLPEEETQYEAYRRVLSWAGDRPVTIRTVDAGGDKPVSGLTQAESNPFLGLRGVRLSLARPDVFRVQIRALLRAGAHGSLKVMLPMVSVPEEVARARALFAEEAARLEAEGVAHAVPPLGIMVEVPSVAVMPESFLDAAFFSIGSNDLTQYVMAAARDNASVAALSAASQPAVLRLIAELARFAAARGMPLSLCGDAGGDPTIIPLLLKAGLRELSVAPAQLALAKAAIATTAL
ncbi:MAG: phosphoenolpyruvate--protein phosphotransferase [Mesorhizobium sp.]